MMGNGESIGKWESNILIGLEVYFQTHFRPKILPYAPDRNRGIHFPLYPLDRSLW